jgi:hypothetical protein
LLGFKQKFAFPMKACLYWHDKSLKCLKTRRSIQVRVRVHYYKELKINVCHLKKKIDSVPGKVFP